MCDRLVTKKYLYHYDLSDFLALDSFPMLLFDVVLDYFKLVRNKNGEGGK